jgi:3-deoxy-manno-octulosonate cytidylyltransferase (CMP-KDO synthetase)
MEINMQLAIKVVIPARYESTRFPGKPLALIHDHPMIWWTWKAVCEWTNPKNVYVATDNHSILTTVHDFGGQAIMTCSNHKSGTDRIVEVLKNMDDWDIAINVQGDEPCITPEPLDALLIPFKKHLPIQMSTLAHYTNDLEILEDPNVVKVVFDKFQHALYFSRSRIPFTRDPSHAFGWRHVGIYAYGRSTLLMYPNLLRYVLEMSEELEQLRALEHGLEIHVEETTWQGIGVDTPSDISKAEARLEG